MTELEAQSEGVYEEGLSALRLAGGQESGSGDGVGPDISRLWECYLNWALERLTEASSDSVRSLKRKVVMLAQCCTPPH